MRRLREERGQVLPLAACGVMILVLVSAGLAIDVGSWYRAQRHAQAVADAAVLAAVQALPDTSAAGSLAAAYASKNGGSLDAGSPAFSTALNTNDTIRAEVAEEAPTYFAAIFGFRDVTVRASATARAYALASLGDVVPLAVKDDLPALHCGSRPCFGQRTTLPFGKIEDVGGGFGLLDFTNSNGNVNPSTLADWITNGYPYELPLGQYQSPGNRFNSNAVRTALSSLGSRDPVVLVPIYSEADGSGNNGVFTIVGFGAFQVESWDGTSSTLTGSFVQTVAHGTHTRGTGLKYYGVSAVSLVG
jgi:hypothetical protein